MFIIELTRVNREGNFTGEPVEGVLRRDNRNWDKIL